MAKWGGMTKVLPGDAITMGNSQVRPLIARNSGAGVALGFSVVEAGSMDVEVCKPELFVVLEGSLTVSSGGETLTVSENELLWIPANSSIKVTTLTPCRVVYAIIGDSN